jgi:S-adenosylmethionine:tRNA ribosyltransferase-isomerase
MTAESEIPAADSGRATTGLRTSDFDYELPSHLIAQRPAVDRDGSRLLVLDRASRAIHDRRFPDLIDYLEAGDALVLNDSRVFPARLTGSKPTGSAAEVLLLAPLPGDDSGRDWKAIVRPGGKLKPGREVVVSEQLRVRIMDSTVDGGRIVRLQGDGDPMALIERFGKVPLPPYVDREADADDRQRYQTVYADEIGSVAAPTAGLHFTPRMLAELETRGVRIVRVTLHVGLGTFRPVDVEDPGEHDLHAERWRLDPDGAAVLNAVRDSGHRIWAVGTTSARVLETAVEADGRFTPGEGWTDLYILPPRRIRGMDGLLTNFHLPKSTLLMLVSAFAGTDFVLDSYRHAVRESYRFYSYGDAMLIL